MSIRLCVGNYALQPYYLEGLNQKVWCMEELCYILKENAFLLDTEIMCDRLVDWISQECGLEELASGLHDMVHKKGSLSAFVCGIQEYVGLYDTAAIAKMEATLKKGAGLQMIEKRKLRIDSLVGQKKYQSAVSEYDALLGGWNDEMGMELKSAIYHNRGTALAGLMRYKEAADSYRLAYEADLSPESLQCFMAAQKMELTSEEYAGYTASLPQLSQTVQMLEKQITQENAQWEQEPDCLRLQMRESLLAEDERCYVEDSYSRLQALKESYRSMVG